MRQGDNDELKNKEGKCNVSILSYMHVDAQAYLTVGPLKIKDSLCQCQS